MSDQEQDSYVGSGHSSATRPAVANHDRPPAPTDVTQGVPSPDALLKGANRIQSEVQQINDAARLIDEFLHSGIRSLPPGCGSVQGEDCVALSPLIEIDSVMGATGEIIEGVMDSLNRVLQVLGLEMELST